MPAKQMSIKNKITTYPQIIESVMMYRSAVCNTHLHKQISPGGFQRTLVRQKYATSSGSQFPTIREFLHDAARKFFENMAEHPNPLVREAVNYN
jgi:hypothetical protein